MDKKVVWSPEAISDLEAICDYIALDSGYYASLFAQDVMKAIEKISQFPGAERIVPEYKQENLRETILQNYRIVYRIMPDMIEIATICHGARILPDL